MNAYYVQAADQITPIYGASSIDEAKQFVASEDHGRIVETGESVFMSLATGSVGFESDWEEGDDVVEVEYSADEERWIEA